jgi:hypothetical protein
VAEVSVQMSVTAPRTVATSSEDGSNGQATRTVWVTVVRTPVSTTPAGGWATAMNARTRRWRTSRGLPAPPSRWAAVVTTAVTARFQT